MVSGPRFLRLSPTTGVQPAGNKVKTAFGVILCPWSIVLAEMEAQIGSVASFGYLDHL